jgi:hypothetical protein
MEWNEVKWNGQKQLPLKSNGIQMKCNGMEWNGYAKV